MTTPTTALASEPRPLANLETIKREIKKDFSIHSITTPAGDNGVHIFFLIRDEVRYRVSVEFEFMAGLAPASIGAWVKLMIAKLSPEHPSIVVLRSGKIRHQDYR